MVVKEYIDIRFGQKVKITATMTQTNMIQYYQCVKHIIGAKLLPLWCCVVFVQMKCGIEFKLHPYNNLFNFLC